MPCSMGNLCLVIFGTMTVFNLHRFLQAWQIIFFRGRFSLFLALDYLGQTKAEVMIDQVISFLSLSPETDWSGSAEISWFLKFETISLRLGNLGMT